MDLVKARAPYLVFPSRCSFQAFELVRQRPQRLHRAGDAVLRDHAQQKRAAGFLQLVHVVSLHETVPGCRGEYLPRLRRSSPCPQPRIVRGVTTIARSACKHLAT